MCYIFVFYIVNFYSQQEWLIYKLLPREKFSKKKTTLMIRQKILFYFYAYVFLYFVLIIYTIGNLYKKFATNIQLK